MWKSLGNIAKKVSTKSIKKIFEGHLTLLQDIMGIDQTNGLVDTILVFHASMDCCGYMQPVISC